MPLFGPPDVEKMKAKRDVNGLIKALNYKQDSEIRENAAKALGEIGDTRAVKPLSIALHDLNNDVRWSTIKALEKLGAPAVEPLIAVLTDSSNTMRGSAAQALRKIGDARAVDPLIAALKDSDRDVRRNAAEALGEIGDARAVEPLIAALKDSDRDVRKSAIAGLDALGWKPSGESQRIYAKIAHNGYDWAALAKSGANAVEPLITALKDSERAVRLGAAEVLEELNWQPKDANERILYGIAKKDWDAVVKEGSAATELLIAVLRTYEAIDLHRSVLKLLSSSVSNVDTVLLIYISQLQDRILSEYYDVTIECSGEKTYVAKYISEEFADVHQLARQELIRRGIKA